MTESIMLRLTLLDGTPFLVNPDHVVSFERNGLSTLVYTVPAPHSQSPFLVRETIAQIAAMLPCVVGLGDKGGPSDA